MFDDHLSFSSILSHILLINLVDVPRPRFSVVHNADITTGRSNKYTITIIGYALLFAQIRLHYMVCFLREKKKKA